MCLIIFRWQPEASEKLILLGNRDEFYARPTREAHRWSEPQNVLAGQDLKALGTWLALQDGKRLCAVTNFREVTSHQGEWSRGSIPIDFLSSDQSARTFAEQLTKEPDKFSGYNALFYDGEHLVHGSNRSETPWQIVPPGDHGLSNHLLNSPWPKLERAKTAMQSILSAQNSRAAALSSELLSSMSNTSQPNDEHLPDTGIGLELERFLSTIFIRGEHYGTRTTSLVIAEHQLMHLWERNYLVESGTTQLDMPTYSDQYLISSTV